MIESQFSLSQKKELVCKFLDHVFETVENTDEFLGKQEITRLSPPFSIIDFKDHPLKGYSFQELNTIMGSLDVNNLEDYFGDALNMKELISLHGGVLDKEVVESVDEWLSKWYTSGSISRLRMDASPEEVEKFKAEVLGELNERRKSIIGDVFDGALKRVLNETGGRARLEFRVLETLAEDNVPSYFLHTKVVSAAQFRKLQDFKLLAILPSGDRRIYEYYNLDLDPVIVEEGEKQLPIYRFGSFYPEIEERVNKEKYDHLIYLRVPKWKTGTYEWFNYGIQRVIPMTLDQIKELFQERSRLSVRFDDLDVRFFGNTTINHILDAFAFYNGDESVIDGLFSQYLKEEREKALKLEQEAKEREERIEREKAEARRKEQAEKEKRAREEKEQKQKKLKELEDKVATVDFLRYDNLRQFVDNPESIREIADVAKYSEESGLDSGLLAKLREVQKKIDREDVLASLSMAEREAKDKSKNRMIGVFATALLCFIIAVSIAMEINIWVGLVFACIGVYALIRKKSLFSIRTSEPTLLGPAYDLYNNIRLIIKS